MTDTPENRVLEVLERIGLPYEVVEIDPAYADTAAFCEKYEYPLEISCNTIVVASKKEPKQFVACVVPATLRLDVNKRVRKLMGVPRASFATSEEMEELTGMKVGGVTPFSLPEGMPLYVEASILDLESIILGGGGRSLKVLVSPEVLTHLGAEMVKELGK